MNKKDTIRQRYAIMDALPHQDRIHTNCVRISGANSYEHELAKFRLCYQLARAGKRFVTEARFTKGGRADILSLDEESGLIYEIVASETEKSLMKKSKEYPFKLVVVRCDR